MADIKALEARYEELYNKISALDKEYWSIKDSYVSTFRDVENKRKKLDDFWERNKGIYQEFGDVTGMINQYRRNSK